MTTTGLILHFDSDASPTGQQLWFGDVVYETEHLSTAIYTNNLLPFLTIV